MTPKLRSALTLLVLVLIMVAAVLWGWKSLTQSVPSRESPPCEDFTAKKGTRLSTESVAVSVLNASGTSGLSRKTMDALVARGFVAATVDNAPAGTDITGIEIWTSTPPNPGVQLVRRQFTQAAVVKKTAPGIPGVVVVIGKNPAKLKEKAPADLAVGRDWTVCGPTPGV